MNLIKIKYVPFEKWTLSIKKYWQAVTAAGGGCQAAIDAEHWFQESNILQNRHIFFAHKK